VADEPDVTDDTAEIPVDDSEFESGA